MEESSPASSEVYIPIGIQCGCMSVQLRPGLLFFFANLVNSDSVVVAASYHKSDNVFKCNRKVMSTCIHVHGREWIAKNLKKHKTGSEERNMKANVLLLFKAKISMFSITQAGEYRNFQHTTQLHFHVMDPSLNSLGTIKLLFVESF